MTLHRGTCPRPNTCSATRFHSAKPTACPVEEPKAEPTPDRPKYTSHFAKALCRLGHEDERVVAITAAMEDGTGLAEFGKAFPGRFFDVGICEQHAVAFAGGLGEAGLTPVLAIYSTFLQRGYDQVFHDVCLQETPVVMCLDRGGLVGADGATHHGVFDIAYLRHVPGLVLSAPKDGRELEAMLETAVASGRTWAFRIPRSPVPAVDWGECPPMILLIPSAARSRSSGSMISRANTPCSYSSSL